MSSRPSTRSNGTAVSAEPFVFASLGGETAGRSSAGPGTPRDAAAQGSDSSGAAAEQKGYERGLAEGEANARAAFEESLGEARGGILETLRQFAAQREGYFQRVESDVVQLALSIARKILHREAQIDPLLLAGVVRVALESLNDGTQVRLRTNPQEILFWRDYFSRASDISPAPELMGDASLAAGCCVLETELGSTQISLETQLKEIEQGFLDLLDQRPRVGE
jgi:flagellar assembly protein FliH